MFQEEALTKEQVEERVIELVRARDKQIDKKIGQIKSRLETARKQNYRLKNHNAQAYSEKAEVEAAFIEGLEEAKREVAKKQSVRMAEKANTSRGG